MKAEIKVRTRFFCDMHTERFHVDVSIPALLTSRAMKQNFKISQDKRKTIPILCVLDCNTDGVENAAAHA